KATLVIEPGLEERASLWQEQIREGHEALTKLPAGTTKALPAPAPEKLYLGLSELKGHLRKRRAELLTGSCYTPVPRFATEPNPIQAYRNFIATQIDADRRIVLTAASSRDLG